MARGRVEQAGARRAAYTAPAVRGDVPGREVVPVAPDQDRLAGVAIGRLARIVDVAGEDVAKAGRAHDPPRIPQGVRQSRGLVRHLPVGAECSEMQRHVRAEAVHDPAA